MSMGGPDRNFWCVRAFLSKVCQKQISRSGTPIIDVFEAFFKNPFSKSLPTEDDSDWLLICEVTQLCFNVFICSEHGKGL